MAEDKTGGHGGHSRTLIIAAAVIGLVLVFFVFELLTGPPGSACDSVFQQTSMQMGVRLKQLDTEGSLVLGRQKIQDLTEQAQLMALNLKTCCIVLDAGKMSSDQFLQCKETTGGYTSKLDNALEQLTQIDQAQQAGDTAAVEEKKRALETVLGEADKLSGKLRRQVKELPRQPLQRSHGDIYLDERFSGDMLSSSWQLNNPDPLRWKHQADSNTLLIITQKGSVRAGDDTLKNQFVLNETIPDADFEAIVKTAIQIQGQQNSLSFALWEDNDNYLEIGFRGFEHGYNTRRNPFFTKELQGQRNKIEAATKGHGGVQEPEQLFLKIERRGNKYSGYYAYVDAAAQTSLQDLAWVEIGTHAWIDFKGRPAVWADNGSGTHYGSGASPEVPVEFDFVLIRKL